MKLTTAILFFVLLFGATCFGQVPDSDARIPKELKGEILYLEKYSEISFDESMDIIDNKTASTKDERLDRIYSYNLVFRRKINNEIESIMSASDVDNIVILSSRDIQEDLNNTIRFVLKADFTAADLVSGKSYNTQYYIYDQLNDIRYKSFSSLPTFLTSFKSFNWYANNRIVAETSQNEIDQYIERTIPKERKRLMSQGTKRTILTVIGVIGINILAYVVSN